MQAVGFNHTPEQAAFADDVILADDVVQRLGTHPRGKRSVFAQLLFQG